jgi:rubrerythrin
LLFGDLISIILTAIIVIPLIFIEAIIRQSRIKNKLKQQKFLICPRCMIPVEKDPGICPNCGIQL